MSGSQPTNNAAVDFEKQQAAEADAKEAARQASLKQGQAAIDAIFNGTPTYADVKQNYDWSTFKPGGTSYAPPSGVPAGYKAVVVPGATTTPSASAASAPSGTTAALAGGAGQYQQPTKQVASVTPYSYTAPTWGLEDASGKIYKQGDPLSYTAQQQTGTTGGFDDAFYNKFNQKVLDYYQPDEQRQYQQAQRDLTYNLARAGTLTSSTAGDKAGDLAYNDALQKANIVANANTQTGNLKNQIQSNKQDLINQLYATSDPTLTANLAESSAKASQLQDPQLTPAANLFTPIAVGATSALSGLGYGPVYGGTAYGQPPQQSPAPASSGASSGKVTYK